MRGRSDGDGAKVDWGGWVIGHGVKDGAGAAYFAPQQGYAAGIAAQGRARASDSHDGCWRRAGDMQRVADLRERMIDGILSVN